VTGVTRHARRLAYLLVGLGILAGLAAMVPSAGAAGNTYYVSTTGSDSNSGTQSAPFKTLAKGVSILNAGDTLYVRSGTYLQTGSLNISRSGTSTARITIAGYPGDAMPVISGDTNGNGAADPTDTPANNRYSPLVNLSGSYITLQGTEVAYSGGNAIRTSANNIISGNNIHHAWNSGISVNGPNNLVENNTVWRTADSNYCGGVGGERQCNGNWPGAVTWGDPNNTTPPGPATNTVIRHNTVYRNSGEGILCFHTDGGLVEGNTVYDNWALGIDLDQCSSTTIKKNLVYYTGDSSWWRGSPARPWTGILLSNEGIAGYTTIGHDRTVTDNIVVGTGTNFDFWTGSAAKSALINDLIADNTFVEAQNGTGIHIDAAASGASHTNTRITNNLVLQSSGTIASVGSTAGLTFDHNLWSRTPSSNVASSTDVVANPLLVDPNHTRTAGSVVADWYKLTSSSPAIGRATALSSVTDDYFGSPRPTTPDIGGHEYGTATNTPVPTATTVPATSTPAPTSTSVPSTATPAPTATAAPSPTTTATPAPSPTTTATPAPSPTTTATPAPTRTTSTTGLVGQWNLDEGTGTTAADSSGDGDTGYLHNSPTWTSGVSGKALKFNGSNNYVQMNDNSVLSPLTSSGEMTIAAWVNLGQRPSTSGQGRTPFLAKGTANNWEYALYAYSNGQIGFTTWQLNGNSYGEAKGGSLPLNQWHLLVATAKKGQFVRVYMDGNLVGQTTTLSGSPGNGSSPLYLARRGDGQYTNTVLDGVRIYNRVLSLSEIQALK
jgi:parallel beta-helix repeat protein